MTACSVAWLSFAYEDADCPEEHHCRLDGGHEGDHYCRCGEGYLRLDDDG
jgi:hypothetical protein